MADDRGMEVHCGGRVETPSAPDDSETTAVTLTVALGRRTTRLPSAVPQVHAEGEGERTSSPVHRRAGILAGRVRTAFQVHSRASHSRWFGAAEHGILEELQKQVQMRRNLPAKSANHRDVSHPVPPAPRARSSTAGCPSTSRGTGGAPPCGTRAPATSPPPRSSSSRTAPTRTASTRGSTRARRSTWRRTAGTRRSWRCSSSTAPTRRSKIPTTARPTTSRASSGGGSPRSRSARPRASSRRGPPPPSASPSSRGTPSATAASSSPRRSRPSTRSPPSSPAPASRTARPRGCAPPRSPRAASTARARPCSSPTSEGVLRTVLGHHDDYDRVREKLLVARKVALGVAVGR